MSFQTPPPQPPRLPDPFREVDSSYVAALLNVLRLFFNQIRSFLAQLQTDAAAIVGANGGAQIQNPCGTFYSSVAQPLTPAFTAGTVSFNTTGVSQGVALVGADTLTPAFAGVYRVEMRARVVNSGAASFIGVWLRRNGVDVLASEQAVATVAGASEYRFSWVESFAAADGVTIIWAVPNTDMSFGVIPAQVSPPSPAISAVTASMVLVSAPVTP